MIGQTRQHPEWRIIVDLFRAASWGDVLTHGTIGAATSLEPETVKYYRHMSQARHVLLRDHDIEVETEAKVGYRRVEPHRYGERSRRAVRLGNRRLRNGERVLRAAPVHLLSAEQAREIEHQMVKLNLLLQQVNSTVRSMRGLLPPVSDTPRQLPAADEHAVQ